jgi:hypothetical protein
LDQRLCSQCCGAHRGRFIRCRPDCTYYLAAEERLRARRARELVQAWTAWRRELDAAGREITWSYVEALAEALAAILHREPADDAEVEAALVHLAQSLSPVVMVGPAPPPLGRILVDLFGPLRQKGEVDGDKLRGAAQAVADWLGCYRSPEDEKRFVRGLLGAFPPPPEEEQGLIVRP